MKKDPSKNKIIEEVGILAMQSSSISLSPKVTEVLLNMESQVAIYKIVS